MPEEERDDLTALWDGGAEWTVYNERALAYAAQLGPTPRCSTCGADVVLYDAHVTQDGVAVILPVAMTHDRAPPLRAVCPGSGKRPLAQGELPLVDQVELLEEA